MIRRRKYDLEYFLFILPAFSLFTLFFIIPFFSGICYSFTSWNGISPNKTFVGLKNYAMLLADGFFWAAFKNTLVFSIIHVTLVNAAALILAMVLVRAIPLKKSLRVCFFLPNVLNLIIVGQIWRFMLGQVSYELGELTNTAFLKIGWLSDPNIALFSVVFASVWQAAGWYMMLFIAGLETIPRELYEAAAIDGAGWFSRFFRITMPLLISTLIVCLFLSTINALRIFDIVYSMTGGGPGRATETAILNIYDTTFNSFFYGYGTAKAVLLLGAIILISFLQIMFLKKREVKY
ncbi:MAG: sugar ABC transporter permease [Spirochaetaceae bacterium]|jgi:raffinose/stachyose/melibiose transport system permease protein|nr:sugar ABC transporter permease [Spirochaetaceae bacterium]